MSSPPGPAQTAGIVREAIDLVRLPWIRPLVSAYAADYASVAPLFAGNPADSSAWRETIERIGRVDRPRAAFGQILCRQLERRGAPRAALNQAALLAHPSTVAIVTGQQAGLFGGPLYTLLKAITAIQLARAVRDEHGVEAVPVFWVDAEDHDWEEIRTAAVLDSDFSLAEVSLAPPDGAGAAPAGLLRLGDDAGRALTELHHLLGPSEFRDELLASLGRHYRPGATMTGAFAGWLDELAGTHGLVVFESDDPAAKPLVADLFTQELDRPAETARLVREAGDTMTRLGHAPQVEPADDVVSLFYLDGHARRAIRQVDGEFSIGGVNRRQGAVREEAASHPERFSPNVLLRPLVQDRLFPTVCYVAGPSELAYQAQLRRVYREFGLEPPLLYSRVSATLIDAPAARFLDRSGMPFEALQAQDESALNRLLERQLPPSIDRILEDLTRQIATASAQLAEAVATVDPTLAGAVETTQARARDAFKNLHGKIVQASKRKDETVRRQFMRAQALMFPGGRPQERALGLPYFLNRHGPALTARLIEGLPRATDKHYLALL